MEMKILQEKSNELLGRKEIKFEVIHKAGATPTKANVRKELAEKYGVPEEHIVIDYIFTRKGIASSEIKAKIYKEKMKVMEKMKAAKTKEEKKEEQKEAKT